MPPTWWRAMRVLDSNSNGRSESRTESAPPACMGGLTGSFSSLRGSGRHILSCSHASPGPRAEGPSQGTRLGTAESAKLPFRVCRLVGEHCQALSALGVGHRESERKNTQNVRLAHVPGKTWLEEKIGCSHKTTFLLSMCFSAAQCRQTRLASASVHSEAQQCTHRHTACHARKHLMTGRHCPAPSRATGHTTDKHGL